MGLGDIMKVTVMEEMSSLKMSKEIPLDLSMKPLNLTEKPLNYTNKHKS